MRNVLTGGITPGREDLSKALNSVRAHVAQLGSPQTKITHVVLLTLKDYYFSLFFLSHIRRHRLRRQTITTTKDASYVLWSSESPSLLGLLARGQSILSPSFCLSVFFFRFCRYRGKGNKPPAAFFFFARASVPPALLAARPGKTANTETSDAFGRELQDKQRHSISTSGRRRRTKRYRNHHRRRRAGPNPQCTQKQNTQIRG